MSDSAEVQRHFAAHPAKVFAAFADANIVSSWLTPSPEVTLSVKRFDFREGGRYEFVYDVPSDRTVVVEGEFTLIESPYRIAFTWVIQPPDEHAGIRSLVSVSIEPDKAGSLLTIRHMNLERLEAISRHAEGWRGALAQLAAVVATDYEKDEQTLRLSGEQFSE